MNKTASKRRRIENALWGLFIGDALAMPVHWYYNPDNIANGFDGGIRRYEAAPHPHPESFMVGMAYHPDIETADRLGRPYDILHEHARFYHTSYSTLGIRSTEREGEHGNATPALEERYHYHHGLTAGENTLGAHLVRVLLRAVIADGSYSPDAFIQTMIAHLTTPGVNRDPYTEIYLRRWFENYSHGTAPRQCAAFQRDIWSIGSHGGLIRPAVIAMLAQSAYQGIGLAVEHMNLTHRSENNISALSILVPLLFQRIQGGDGKESIRRFAPQVRAPRISGPALFAAYRDHGGPGNIPKDRMWEMHTALSDTPLDIDALLAENDDASLGRAVFASACYAEHGLPLLLALAARHGEDVEAALLANANIGGDNVHRGMLLGMIAGAGTNSIPDRLKRGLADNASIENEIEGFAEVVLRAGGF